MVLRASNIGKSDALRVSGQYGKKFDIMARRADYCTMSASLTVFEKEHAMTEKYIYFLCGLAGALVAYIGKDYHVVHPVDLSNKLTLLAMATLTLSLMFGMAHIQVFINATSKNKDVLVTDEEIRNYIMALVERKAGKANYSINAKTGKEYTSEDMEKEIDIFKAKREAAFRKMTRRYKCSTVLSIVCQSFLIIGFFLIIWSKLAL